MSNLAFSNQKVRKTWVIKNTNSLLTFKNSKECNFELHLIMLFKLTIFRCQIGRIYE